MVALGKTRDSKAYQLIIIGHFNYQSPSDWTKLREEDLYEELPFVLNVRAPAIATTLAKGEVLESPQQAYSPAGPQRLGAGSISLDPSQQKGRDLVFF